MTASSITAASTDVAAAGAMAVIECVDLEAELAFFSSALGCRVEVVRPADDPRSFVLSSGGFRVELRRATHDRPVRLWIPSVSPCVSPGGSVIESDAIGDREAIPDNRPSLTIIGADVGGFGVGRAGMQYRDLLPDRWGGRFIASHIRIGDEGDVADWVHFHRIRFQMIFVASGWVDVVYEDQGEPFRMHAGDCVLQPPEIRHRVLRSSAGLEVIEIGCPAEHDTFADHDLTLPTECERPERDFGGQRFVRHIARDIPAIPWIEPALVARDTGIGAATNGLAGAYVVSNASPDSRSAPRERDALDLTHHGEFAMIVGLAGDAELEIGGAATVLEPRTAVALPPGTVWRWTTVSADHEALVVTLPSTSIERAAG